jgi:outer membrane receptor for monomeric catechols
VAGGADPATASGIRSQPGDELASDALHTPPSVSVVTAEAIDSRADIRLEEAPKNIEGITLDAGEGAERGRTFNPRGFCALQANDASVSAIVRFRRRHP